MNEYVAQQYQDEADERDQMKDQIAEKLSANDIFDLTGDDWVFADTGHYIATPMQILEFARKVIAAALA